MVFLVFSNIIVFKNKNKIDSNIVGRINSVVDFPEHIGNEDSYNCEKIYKHVYTSRLILYKLISLIVIKPPGEGLCPVGYLI